MSDRLVVVLADNGFAAALIENLYGVVIGRRNPELTGKMPDEFVKDLGGGHDTTPSLDAVPTNPVVLREAKR
jgi:hypothetical protein